MVLLSLALIGNLAGCGNRIERVPVSAEALKRCDELVREGDVSFARRDYYPALIKYSEASKLNPYNENIFNKLGISYSALAFYSEAEEALKRALALNKKSVFVHNNLGTVYFARGNLGKAEKHFKKAIKMNSRVASFHVNLGQTYMEKGKYKRGIREIRRGLALDPNVLDKDQTIVVSSPRGNPSPEKSYNLARIYASLGKVDRTIQYLQEAISFGFVHLAWVNSEPDFDTVRDNQKFALFLSEARMKNRVIP